MFGVTTAWKSTEIKDGNQLMDALEQTGIPGIELEYHLTSEILNQIQYRMKHSHLEVLSLHNYCPHPEILPINRASGDAFWLSAIEENERKLAVQYSLRTMWKAHELGAKAVVLHSGRIAMPLERQRWFDLCKDNKFQGAEKDEFLQRKHYEREQAQKPYFEALLKSLDQLHKEAEKLNILIGIENRYYYDELPNFEEIKILLDTFRGGKIGYWHDTGHAQTYETFGLCAHEKFLQAYSDQLIGIHLHDSQDYGYNDHFAPGSGLIDFDMIKKYLPDSAIRIIEVHAQVSFDELQQGIKFLKQKRII